MGGWRELNACWPISRTALKKDTCCCRPAIVDCMAGIRPWQSRLLNEGLTLADGFWVFNQHSDWRVLAQPNSRCGQ
jgi:hypothetical protein